MKRNIKKFLFPAVAVAALSLAACSDWTETESLDINYPSLEEQNPELYKRVKNTALNWGTNIPTEAGRQFGLAAYHIAQKIFKFN